MSLSEQPILDVLEHFQNLSCGLQIAWIVAEIFTEGAHKLGRKFAAQGRQILLLVSNSSAHYDVKGLMATHLTFLLENNSCLVADRGCHH